MLFRSVVKPFTHLADEFVHAELLQRNGSKGGFGKRRQHHGEGRLFVILLARGTDAYTDRAGPTHNAGLYLECFQDVAQISGQHIGCVEETEVGFRGNGTYLGKACFDQPVRIVSAAVSELKLLHGLVTVAADKPLTV